MPDAPPAPRVTVEERDAIIDRWLTQGVRDVLAFAGDDYADLREGISFVAGCLNGELVALGVADDEVQAAVAQFYEAVDGALSERFRAIRTAHKQARQGRLN